MTIQNILFRLKGVKGGDGQWSAKCPAHDDKRNSLSVSIGEDKRVLLHCHAGCNVGKITQAMGLTVKDLFVEQQTTGRDKPPIVATYTYPSGAQKLRRANKSFTWRRPDGNGGWVWNRKGVPHELYIAGDLSGMIHVVEGEKDADNFHTQIGGCAVCGADGAGPGKWRKEYTAQLKGRPVVILQDNDDVGRAYAQETAAALHGVAKSVRLIDLSLCWPDIPEHGDISDMLEAKGVEEAVRLLVELEKKTPKWEPGEVEEQATEVQPLGVISAQKLQTADLPPVKFLIEGILPDGTSLLTAASKIGKSWMVLDMGLSLAAGQPFLGHQCNQCDVLYLALEDSYNRLQNRMNKILRGKPAPEHFYFATEAPKLDNGLLDTLGDYLKKHPDTKFIIIDTLQKIRGQALPREASYAQDYREMETIKAFLDKRGVSAVFVHHNRKMKDDDDPFNMISGTNGIMGATDTIWTITKAKRTDKEATLHITGRDVEQSDTVIRFDKGDWRWKKIGSADWLAEQRARLEYDSSPIVKTIKKLLEQSPSHRWNGQAKDLMEAGKYIAHTYLATDSQKLGYAIKSLEKPLFEFDGIVHTASKNGNAGNKHSFYYQDLSQFENLEGDQEEMPWQTT